MAVSEFLGLQYILETGVWSTLFPFFFSIQPQADGDFSVFAITQKLAGACSVLGTS